MSYAPILPIVRLHLKKKQQLSVVFECGQGLFITHEGWTKFWNLDYRQNLVHFAFCDDSGFMANMEHTVAILGDKTY